jgi:uncharacterized UBP type Zn finger protein
MVENDEHMEDANLGIEPKTQGCEEHEKEGKSDWVALRLCLTCGHVGCCDSTPGTHATAHFNETGHAVMMSLPKSDSSWKWCYIHKDYVK